jgi:hypothetical protein
MAAQVGHWLPLDMTQRRGSLLCRLRWFTTATVASSEGDDRGRYTLHVGSPFTAIGHAPGLLITGAGALVCLLIVPLFPRVNHAPSTGDS